MKETHYRQLLAMAVLSFGAMYVLMYAWIDDADLRPFNRLQCCNTAGCGHTW
jgi:hypothetical protein